MLHIPSAGVSLWPYFDLMLTGAREDPSTGHVLVFRVIVAILSRLL